MSASSATAHHIRDGLDDRGNVPTSTLSDSDDADLTWVDGLLTSAAIGPDAVSPSEWIDAYYGKDYERRAAAIVEPLMRAWQQRHDRILHDIQDARGGYQPDFLARSDRRRTIDRAIDWSHGFCKGIGLRQRAWQALKPRTPEGDALATITMFIEADGDHPVFGNAPRLAIEAERRKVVADIGPAIEAIYAFWRGRARTAGTPPDRGLVGRVGRTEACPCGSGLTYEKCCLN